MRTSNPTLSESAFNRMMQPGATTAGAYVRTDAFTVEGAIYKTALLLAIAVVTALATALLVPDSMLTVAVIGGVILGLPLVIATTFKPAWAPVTAPLYALVEGVVLGAVSLIFERMFPGIALQAAVGTGVVLAVMLTLYRTGVIRVTQRFRMVVATATGAIFITYLLSFVLGFFGISFGFLHDSSLLSIGISALVIVVAALNLALDFDFIENAANRGAPAKVEWYAAFGLLVTLVWLYLEILRLLAKLQSRD